MKINISFEAALEQHCLKGFWEKGDPSLSLLLWLGDEITVDLSIMCVFVLLVVSVKSIDL